MHRYFSEEAGYPITHHKTNMINPLIIHADQSQIL